MPVRDTSRQAREHSPEDKEGYVFVIKEDHPLPHFWVDVKAYVIISSFDPILFNWGCHGTI